MAHPAQMPKDGAPEPAMLQALAAPGPLSLEINRNVGGVLETVHQGDRHSPEEIANIYPSVAAYAGGGLYSFKVWQPQRPDMGTIQWKRQLPGAPRKVGPDAGPNAAPPVPLPLGMAAPIPMAASAGMPMSAPAWPQAPAPAWPPAYPYQYMPWQAQMPYGQPWPQMGLQGQQQAGQSDLMHMMMRQNEEQRHARELERVQEQAKQQQELLLRQIEEIKKSVAEQQKESATLQGFKELREALTVRQADPTVEMIKVLAQQQSGASSDVLRAVLEVAKGGAESKKDPVLTSLLQHLMDQQSPKHMNEMVATSGEIMSTAMQMMAHAMQQAGAGGGGGEAGSGIERAMDKIAGLGRNLVAGAQQQKAAEMEMELARQQAAPQQLAQHEPSAPVQMQQPQPQAPPQVDRRLPSDIALEREEHQSLLAFPQSMQPFVDKLRSAVKTGNVTADQAAGSFADILFRFYSFGVDTDAIVGFIRDPEGSARRLLPFVSKDYLDGFLKAILPAAQKAGFTTEDLQKLALAS